MSAQPSSPSASRRVVFHAAGLMKNYRMGEVTVQALRGVEEQRVRVISNLATAPQRWRGLGDGYRVEARFILWRGDDVLQVASSALFRVGDRWAVFVVHNGRAQRRWIELGHRSGLAAQVMQGLSAGEKVVVYPDDTLDDGARVASRATERQPAP